MSAPSAAFAAAFAAHRAGRLAEAEAAYAAVPADDPNARDALHLRGLALLGLGRGEEGTALLERAVALNPASALYRSNLLVALETRGARALAARIAREGGEIRLDAGDALGARTWYRRACALDPFDIVTIHDQALAASLHGDGEEAARWFARAVRSRPDLDACRAGLVNATRAIGRHDRALTVARDWAARDPANPTARVELGNCRKHLGEIGAAEAEYRRAIAADPGAKVAWFNLAVTLGDHHAHLRAIPAYRAAARLDPGDATTRFNLAHDLLIVGRWEEGWAEFEHRLDDGTLVPDRGRPRWRGGDPAGRTILFQGEQGHGDTLQFIRYAPLIAALGARVVVECQPALVRLAARVPGVAAAHPPGAARDFDLVLPMMSAPFEFGTRPDTVPARVPYLDPDPVDRARLGSRLPEAPVRIGLVWAGEPRPDQPRLHRADKRRSVPLADLAPVWRTAGAAFVSLQLGAARDQLRDLPQGAPIVDVMDDVRDFADTAALVAELDLVIAVDTSVAHLAGGLGVPVWLLSRYDGCWRWLLDREDSPWYPGARVFAQAAPGDWGGVIDRVARALPEFVAHVVSSRAS